jgi:hypothetical protein
MMLGPSCLLPSGMSLLCVSLLMIKVDVPGLPSVKLLFFLFAISKYSVGNNLKLCKYPLYTQLLLID